MLADIDWVVGHVRKLWTTSVQLAVDCVREGGGEKPELDGCESCSWSAYQRSDRYDCALLTTPPVSVSRTALVSPALSLSFPS